MDLSLNDEQRQLQDSIARWVQDRYSFEARHQVLQHEHGFDPANWANFAELGWLGLPFDEADGGFGFGPTGVMLLAEELGKGLVAEPYVPSVVMGGGFLRRADASVKGELLPRLIGGELQMAFAYAEADSRHNPYSVATRAEDKGGSYLLNGAKSVVWNGPAANWLAVTARISGGQHERDGLGVFLVPADAAGVDRRDYRTNDSLPASEVSLANVEVPAANLVGDADVLDQVIAEALLALGAEATGCMEVLYKDTVEYSRTREQFGVPIGSFQVLQHRMVDMFMEHEQTKSLLYMAAVRMAEGGAAAQRAVSALKAQVGKAGRLVGQEAIQIHGGMGMTDELRVGHYFKRLTMLNLTLGDADHHLKRFASLG